MLKHSRSTLGRYHLLSTLGEGSFGTVYRAWDPDLHREVAVKALSPLLARNPDDKVRFLKEARSLAHVSHRGIVSVYDVGEEELQPFFAMQLVRGRTLAALLAENGALPLDQVCTIIEQLAGAIDHLHGRNIVHRDIKDTNVMVDESGHVLLMDLGIALSPGGSRVTRPGGYKLLTPEAAAPEQIEGKEVGPSADIYALGILTYQMLSGQLPFSGDLSHVLYAQVNLAPPPLQTLRPELAPHICTVVEKALAKAPGDRPSSAAAFVAQLAPIATPEAEAEFQASEPEEQHLTTGFVQARTLYTLHGQPNDVSEKISLTSGPFVFRFETLIDEAALLDMSGARKLTLVEHVSHASDDDMLMREIACTLNQSGEYYLFIRAPGTSPWTASISRFDSTADTYGGSEMQFNSSRLVFLALEAGLRRIRVTCQSEPRASEFRTMRVELLTLTWQTLSILHARYYRPSGHAETMLYRVEKPGYFALRVCAPCSIAVS